MAWTSPMTAIVGAVLTAAQWNSSVRDNLNETAVAKAANPGGYFVATGVNELAQRLIANATVSTEQNTSSTSYTNLTTVGPSVTVTTGTQALVIVSAMCANDTAGSPCFVDFAVSGATTRPASDTTCYRSEHDSVEFNRGSVINWVTLNAGVNTFTMQYKVTGSGPGRFRDRDLIVIPF